MPDPTIVVGGVTYSLPVNDGVGEKVARYNEALEALADAVLDSTLPGVAWASWTPTWTNLSVGNGTVVAKYSRIGKTVHCRLSLTFGSSTSVSGSVLFTLPVTSVAYPGSAGITPLGQVVARDNSAPQVYFGLAAHFSTTQAVIRFNDSSGTYVVQAITSSTVPFTWAVSDEITVTFSYEAA